MMYSPDIESKLEEFHFDLPKDLIAQTRTFGENNLLVVDLPSGELIVSKTSLLDKFLPPSVNFFYNASGVLPTRHIFQSANKRNHEVLFIDQDYDQLPLVCVKVRNLSKLKIGDSLSGNGLAFVYKYREEHLAFFESPFRKKEEVIHFHQAFGLAPSPPYMKQVDDLKEYQNPLGDLQESIAAPTSCYHFTDEVYKKFLSSQFHKVYLRVGLGTFEPILNFDSLHSEKFQIPEKTNKAFDETESKNRCIVGTTALRALESSLRQKSLTGKTNIFLKYDNLPQLAFGFLITNFHLPKSSLFMLICSILGKELAFKAYEKAIEEKFKFFSFGDAMLIRK